MRLKDEVTAALSGDKFVQVVSRFEVDLSAHGLQVRPVNGTGRKR